MTFKDSLNRGFNLLATSILGLSGFAFLPEAFLEKDAPDKIDDVLVFLIGLGTMLWYGRGENRFKRSFLPVAHVFAAAAVKLAGVIIEFGDPESVGDDFGGLILFLLAAGLVYYQYKKTERMLSAAEPSSA